MKKKLSKKFYVVLLLFIIVVPVFNVTWSKRAGNIWDYNSRCGRVPDGEYDQSTGPTHLKTVCSESPKYDAIKKEIDGENIIVICCIIVLIGLFGASIVLGELKGGAIIVLVYIIEQYILSLFM